MRFCLQDIIFVFIRIFLKLCCIVFGGVLRILGQILVVAFVILIYKNCVYLFSDYIKIFKDFLLENMDVCVFGVRSGEVGVMEKQVYEDI